MIEPKKSFCGWDICYIQQGLLSRIDFDTITLFGVLTNPFGSHRSYLSIGKLEKTESGFNWVHYATPDEFIQTIPDLFALRTSIAQKGAYSSKNWDFLLSQRFIDEGWLLAKILPNEIEILINKTWSIPMKF